MGRLAGIRRGEAYPSSRNDGGASSSVPLSRQRFIDGDTAQTGLNGSAAQPFKTIAEFIASRTDADTADATANYVGWVTPCKSGYAEDVDFPAYVSTELRADSLSLTADAGVSIAGSMHWHNIAGTNPNPASRANVAVHNLIVTGTFGYEDDDGAPNSSITFSADEVGFSGALLGGFGSNGSTKLLLVSFYNYLLGGTITCGVSSDSAPVALVNCSAQSIVAKAITAVNTAFTGDSGGNASLEVADGEVMRFSNCTFSGTDIQLTCRAGAIFDGPSWKSYVSGCTGGVDRFQTPVLVIGGFSGAEVEGAASVAGSGTIDLSLNGTGATAGFTGSNSGNHYTFTAQSGDATAHLLTGGGERSGDTMLITKADLAAHTLTVTDDVGGVIGVIASGKRGAIEALFNGTHWVFLRGGELAA